MKILAGLVLLLFLGVTTAGCLVVKHPDGSTTLWVPQLGHIHNEHCGHYHHRGQWFQIRGHHSHGPGCGHRHHNGMWIHVD